MTDYLGALPNNNYIPNIVILFAGQYFSMRQPDSGLVIDSAYLGTVGRVSINPTSIDPFRPTVTFNTNSFTLLDKAFAVSALFVNQKGFRTGQEVRFWLGRCGVGMDFSDYLELPRTFINKVQKVENSYNFSTMERRDRLSGGAFNQQTKLSVDILAGTTTITIQDPSVLINNPGYIKIGDEFISFTTITGNNLEGCVRGEFGSTPEAHEEGETIYEVTDTGTVNPLDLLLQLLISTGGGGTYDVFLEGAGIDEALIDVAQFEEIRDEFFSTWEFDFKLWGIESLQTFIEQEIFYPLGVRLRSNNNSKIGIALLNRNIFEIDSPQLNHDNITKNPSFQIDENKIENRVRIFWDWSDGKNKFLKVSEFEDAESVAQFGPLKHYELSFKGPSDADVVESIANLFLGRFAFPKAEISVNALNNTSYLNIGDKVDLTSSLLPTDNGDLDFVSTMEVVKKSYNPSSGDVSYQLAFTSFSGVKQCIIAPSDTILSFTNQKVVTIATGRGVYYRAGWKMRLYSNTTRDHASSQVNEIESIAGDVITFVDDWSTILTDMNFKIMFADHDQVVEQQKKFCFISDDGNNFPDGSKTYQVTYS